MSVEDDVALFEEVPTLRVLGSAALRLIAIGSENRDVMRGDRLFTRGDEADAGYVIRRGVIRMEDGSSAPLHAARGMLIGQLAMIVPVSWPTTATALEISALLRIPRSLFRRVLEVDVAAAHQLRQVLASRSGRIASDLDVIGNRLRNWTTPRSR
ncbi:MAG: Crp/Fnr family transcriptional regulator [Alphaproteobacteria bacterium]|nr:Crp/Fnr family transcriptional regulator [Alphaproteobacteria bacterium]